MAKLIIYRGDVVEKELDLGEQTVRIGRDAANDLVLTDPTRSVSRYHAELRYEQGAYSVVDTNSQNGIWVAGLRVPNTTLEPGVPVLMGAYKLVLKGDPPPVPGAGDSTVILRLNTAAAADATMILRRDALPATLVGATASSLAPPQPAQVPTAPIPVVAPAQVLPSMAPPLRSETVVSPPVPPPPPAPVKAEPPPVVEPPKVAAPPPPAPRPAPPPPPPAAAPQPAPAASVAAAKPARAGGGRSKSWLYAGLAIIAVGALAVLSVAALRRWRSDQAVTAPPSTSASVASGPVAPPAQITPASSPTLTPTTPKPASAAPTHEARPESARKASPPVAAHAGTKPPVDARPREPKPPKSTAANATATPAPARVAKPAPPNLSAMLEEARSAVIKGDYPAAIAKLEALLKIDPNYPNADNMLDLARSGARNSAQLAIDSGNRSELNGDYAGAAKQYQRAQQLDPSSTAATDAMRRLNLRMQGEGEDVVKRAKAAESAGHKPDAIALYEKALTLLPAEHPSAKLARDALAALKGGA